MIKIIFICPTQIIFIITSILLHCTLIALSMKSTISSQGVPTSPEQSFSSGELQIIIRRYPFNAESWYAFLSFPSRHSLNPLSFTHNNPSSPKTPSAEISSIETHLSSPPSLPLLYVFLSPTLLDAKIGCQCCCQSRANVMNTNA
jgi:hypothetical protein